MNKETIDTLRDLQLNYLRAEQRQSGWAAANERERFKNGLFNHAEELLKAAEEVARLKEEVAALDAALAEADDEIKALKAAPPPKKKQPQPPKE